jgi:hypothetical protein
MKSNCSVYAWQEREEVMSPKHNDVLKALFQRRSIRAFTPEPVDRESVETILEAG